MNYNEIKNINEAKVQINIYHNYTLKFFHVNE